MKNAEALKVVPRGDREIVVTQTLGAPRELVFDALNKPELLRRWMYDRMAAPYRALPRLALTVLALSTVAGAASPLARSLAVEPAVLLLDEPLSALDPIFGSRCAAS